MKKTIITVVSVIVVIVIAVVLIAGSRTNVLKAFKVSFTPSLGSLKIAPKSGSPYSLNISATIGETDKQTSINCKAERDAKGHFFINPLVNNPKTGAQSYKIWLADNTVIVKIPGAVSNGFSPLPTTWYYKFKNSTIEKLKSDFDQLKEINGKNTYADSIKNLLCFLKVSNVSYKRDGGNIVATIDTPLKKWMEGCRKDNDNRLKESKITIDMANTIYDDLTSSSSLTDKQTEETKKNMDSTLSSLLNGKPAYEKSLTDTDKAIVTITYNKRSGLISRITVKPEIKNTPQLNNHEYAFNFSYGKGRKISSVKGNINNFSFTLTPQYNSGVANGMELLVNGNDFKINLVTERHLNDKSVGIIKVPVLYDASNAKEIINLILNSLNQW